MAKAAMGAGMVAGRFCLDIPATAFPGRKSRGFLVPGSAALLATGLVGSGVSLRRRASRPGCPGSPGHNTRTGGSLSSYSSSKAGTA